MVLRPVRYLSAKLYVEAHLHPFASVVDEVVRVLLMGDHISLSAGCPIGLPCARSYCVGGLVRPTNVTNIVLVRTGHTVAGLRTQRDGRAVSCALVM